MVKVSLLIASVRSKLGDTNAKNFRYSNEEILDALNLGLTDLSQEALAFHKSWVIELKEGIDRYAVPNDFIVLTHNKKVPNSNELIEYCDSQTFYIYEEPKEACKDIVIYYNYTEYIYDENIDLKIPNGFAKPLVHFALAELFMSPNRENGLNFSEFHKSKYEESLVTPLHYVRMATNKKRPRTKHRRM